MPQSTRGDAAAPLSMRIVRWTTGQSLTVALPLPPGMGAPPAAVALSTDNRAFWERYSQSPVGLRIGTILLSLGLKQINPGPGRPAFQSDKVTQLAGAVADSVTRLPDTLEELLDVASNLSNLRVSEEVALLQFRFGDKIWGAGEERTWLLQASEAKAEYHKDLFFENSADRDVEIGLVADAFYRLNANLRLWILAKAFNALRNKIQRKSIGRSSKSSLPTQNTQVDVRSDPLSAAAAADLATISSVVHSSLGAPGEQVDPPANKNLQVCGTARIPKPRQLRDTIDYSSDTALEEHLSSELDPGVDTSKHFKGKGQTWRKTEIDENPTFQVATNARMSKPRTDAPRPRGRPKGRKSGHALCEEIVLHEGSDTDAAVFSNKKERQSRRLRQVPRVPPAYAPTPTQERNGIKKQDVPELKGKQRPQKRYLSEEVVRNSSDNLEEDNILIEASPYEDTELVVGTETRYITTQSGERHNDNYNLRIKGAGSDSKRSLRLLEPPVKSKSPRQPPGSCKSCARRHQKCDRARPSCSTCARLDCSCIYPQDSTTVSGSTPTTCRRNEQPSISGQSTTEDVNSEHFLQEGSVTGSTMPLAKQGLRMDQYWDKETWRTFFLRGNECQIFLATMRSLGLKVTPRHRNHFRFDIEHFVVLGKDVNKIAKELSDGSSAAQLIGYAADPDYLNDHIDTLLDTHSSIWSLDADRTNLLTAGAEKEYPNDLFYEESGDQKLLWIHLYRWIFIVALRHCKERSGLKVEDMDKIPQWEGAEVPNDMLREYQLEGTYAFYMPEESQTPSPLTDLDASSSAIDTHQPCLTAQHGNKEPTPPASPVTEPALEEYGKDLLESLGHFFTEQKRHQNEPVNEPARTETHLTPEPEPATRRLTKRRRKRTDSGTTDIEQQDVFRPHKQRRQNQHRKISKGHDLSALFMSYLENYIDPEFDELIVLKNFAHELSVLKDYATNFHTQKGIEFATAFFIVCFPAWLLYRQEIVNAKRTFASMQPLEQAPNRHVAVMERSRLATHLRQVHEEFMDAGHAGLRPEQVIYKAMITLMNEHDHSQTAENIRTGFQGMENELKMLGDQLVSGGAKWICGDFVSVTQLKYLKPHEWVGRDARRLTLGLAGLGGPYA